MAFPTTVSLAGFTLMLFSSVKAFPSLTCSHSKQELINSAADLLTSSLPEESVTSFGLQCMLLLQSLSNSIVIVCVLSHLLNINSLEEQRVSVLLIISTMPSRNIYFIKMTLKMGESHLVTLKKDHSLYE